MASLMSSPSSSSLLTCFSFFFFFYLMICSVRSTPPAALYVFGDSLADVGNNNHLEFSLLKANYPHNGIDYPDKATGRFCNGKNAADFIAEKVGLPSSVPYLSLSSTSNKTDAFLTGLSFASGGAGVLDSTNSNQCISFNKQIDYYSAVYGYLVKQFGTVPTQSHLSKSIFSIVIGSNEIINYAKSNSSNKGSSSTPQQFLDSLLFSLRPQLKRIYNLGARKFVFVGAGTIGCCPSLRQLNKTDSCNELANYLSVQYNKGVISLLDEMKAEFDDMSYSFFDTNNALLEYINNPATYGFVEVKEACCGLGVHAKLACLPIATYCANRKNHIFWDSYHPTEAAADLLTSVAMNGSPPLVYPINIKQLLAI